MQLFHFKQKGIEKSCRNKKTEEAVLWLEDSNLIVSKFHFFLYTAQNLLLGNVFRGKLKINFGSLNN